MNNDDKSLQRESEFAGPGLTHLVGDAREDLEGAPEGGSRYAVAEQMDGRDFARFPVDVGIGDEGLEPLDTVTGGDWLGFGGVAAASFPAISAEQQFAEKLHAYSLPRGERANTRTKDRIDMVLLIRSGKISNSSFPFIQFENPRSLTAKATNASHRKQMALIESMWKRIVFVSVGSLELRGILAICDGISQRMHDIL